MTRGGQTGGADVRLAIVDYGMGNLRSVEKAFERVGVRCEITSNHGVIAAADGLVLPGVGAFAAAMERIAELELDRAIAERVDAGTPVLGICLGFQLLFDSSTELGGAGGLGLIEGEVGGLRAGDLKVPHIGWESVDWERSSELVSGIPGGTPFYFVHSFAPTPRRAEDVVGTAVHGERFACAIARPPVFGVQFHPEKSSSSGLALLANFGAICSNPAVAAA